MKLALKLSVVLLSGMALCACKPSARNAKSYISADLQAAIDQAEGQPNRRFRIDNYQEVNVQRTNLGPESYASELQKIIVRYDVLLDDVGLPQCEQSLRPGMSLRCSGTPDDISLQQFCSICQIIRRLEIYRRSSGKHFRRSK
jgi:hypothetical protein